MYTVKSGENAVHTTLGVRMSQSLLKKFKDFFEQNPMIKKSVWVAEAIDEKLAREEMWQND